MAKKGQVNCHCCNGNCRKSGSYRNRNRIVQRYACDRCGKSFSELQPLDGLRIETKQAEQVVHLLVEGMGIRAISRFTGLDTKTVLNILEIAGQKAAQLLDSKIRNVKAAYIQADEIHCFCGCREMNNFDKDPERGEQYTYLSVDRDSKLIINWLTSKKRSRGATLAFIQDLRSRVTPDRFQL